MSKLVILEDDERYATLRTRGYDICEVPQSLQCWDLYLNVETSEDVYCMVKTGKKKKYHLLVI